MVTNYDVFFSIYRLLFYIRCCKFFFESIASPTGKNKMKLSLPSEFLLKYNEFESFLEIIFN